jgi:hypothetical protein
MEVEITINFQIDIPKIRQANDWVMMLTGHVLM